MSATKFSPIRKKLLRWYDHHKRDLPWRRSRDPYAIWLAETMLQQTQVKTVLPYYERFLLAFPNVAALARARRERVLRLWSGLGYYRRADNLHKAARQLKSEYGSAIPQTYEDLRSLAGVGDYTAGAILSIAFQKRYPAVDGNVRRVLGRIYGAAGERELRALALRLIPRSRPGDFNQALMELGATVCIPKNPACANCPVNLECADRKRNRGGSAIPRRRVEFVNVTWPLAIVRRRGKILLRRRPAHGLLAGLWELPGGESPPGRRTSEFLRSELAAISLLNVETKKLGEFRHAITHRRIRAPIYLLDCPANCRFQLTHSRWHWIDPSEIRGHAVSSMTLKALKLLAGNEATSD
jgi:A/G-specific adenine glycosylase